MTKENQESLTSLLGLFESSPVSVGDWGGDDKEELKQLLRLAQNVAAGNKPGLADLCSRAIRRISELEQLPKIKPLVWKQSNPEIEEWRATTPLGMFRIIRKHPDCPVSIYMAPFIWAGTARLDFNSAEEAKAACQQEYKRRVRECLE